jgi:molybdate transport system substrate-binding protein
LPKKKPSSGRVKVEKAYLWQNWYLALGSALLLSGLVECSGGSGDEETSTLTVLAAASLTDAFGEFEGSFVEGSFEEQNPGAAVQVSFAGTSELLTQIQQGASADVFASADKA